MNSNNSSNSKAANETPKIKRRNFFVYLGAGAISAYALTKLPFKLFQQKLKAEASVKVQESPYAVKRDAGRKNNLSSRNGRSENNG
jgi:hypothetical protein